MGPQADSTRPETRPSETAAIPFMPSMARYGRRCRGWQLEPGQLLGLAADRAGRRGRRPRIWFNDSTKHWPGRRWRSRPAAGLWRSWVAQRQADTAEQGLLNERYQRGAEMLGSDVLAVRLGGIYALQRLAEEHPQQYHIQIMRLFCAVIRNPTVDSHGETGLASQETGEAAETHEDGGGVRPRQDVEAVMEAIATRKTVGLELERDIGFRLDFRRADLSCLDLLRVKGMKLSGAILTDANLSGIRLPPGTNLSSIRDGYEVNLSKARLNRVNFGFSNLWKADLSNSLLVGSDLQIADLRHANLSGATLANADMSGTSLRCANLSGAKFSIDDHPPARGLTQAQIDQACADRDNPPELDGVLDRFTGTQLVWRGKPLDDKT